jgi:hypothetical protein
LAPAISRATLGSMETQTVVPTESVEKLRAAYAEAVELADGEAVDACIVLLGAVKDFLGHAAS